MRGSSQTTLWSRHVLSLILLTANIGAPFRSTALGRTLLEDLRPHPAACSLVRVRGTSPVGISLGFRAVVGFEKGGPGEAETGATAPTFPAHGSELTGPHFSPRFDLRAARPNPPCGVETDPTRRTLGMILTRPASRRGGSSPNRVPTLAPSGPVTLLTPFMIAPDPADGHDTGSVLNQSDPGGPASQGRLLPSQSKGVSHRAQRDLSIQRRFPVVRPRRR